MKILYFGLIVLVCSTFTCMAEAGVGSGAGASGDNAYVEASTVIYSPPPVVSHEQQSYRSESCSENECSILLSKEHHKQNQYPDDHED